MSERVRRLVLIGWAGLVEVVLVLNLLWPLPNGQEDESWPWVAGLMAFPVAATFVLIHRPGNRVGRALGLTSVSAGLIFLLTWYAVTFPDGPLSRHAEAIERLPAIGQFVGMVALLYLFPTGRGATALFERVFRIFVMTMTALGIIWLLSPEPHVVTGRSNPFGILPEWTPAIGQGGFALLVPFILAGVVSLVVRWRRAGVVERAQLKWFLAAAIFTFGVLLFFNLVPGGEEESVVVYVSFGVLGIAAFWSIPAAIAIAIVRHNLYDIDRILNRTAVYATLTAGLGALYFVLVVGLQALLRPVSGGSDFAIVITTLVVAALFLPVRGRVQQAVDRRFNRRSYDANRTIDSFSARLREQIDLDTLRYELLAVVDETMQPERVSVWLRNSAPEGNAR